MCIILFEVPLLSVLPLPVPEIYHHWKEREKKNEEEEEKKKIRSKIRSKIDSREGIRSKKKKRVPNENKFHTVTTQEYHQTYHSLILLHHQK